VSLGPGEDGSWYHDIHGGDMDADLGGISMREMVAFHARPPDPPGTEWLPGVVYAAPDGRELRLWGYRSLGVGAPRPGIVFVHGGGWIGGHPFMHLRHCWALAQRGMVAVTIEYRRYPEATWPAAIDDAKAAMRWMRANADGLGLDPGRLAVAGGSAGGHLALLVALMPGDPSARADAAVVWYPVTDMHCEGVPDLRQAAVDFLGGDDEALTVESSPVTYVGRSGPPPPPTLIITGDADETVPLEGVRAFHESLVAAGGVSRLHVVPGAIHGWDFAPSSWELCFGVLSDFLADVL
jgi:acetyl esterase